MYSDKPSCLDGERAGWRSKKGDKVKNMETDPQNLKIQWSKHSFYHAQLGMQANQVTEVFQILY